MCWILLKESVSTVHNRAFITGILVVKHTVTSPISLLPTVSLSPTNLLLSSSNYSSFNSPAPLSCGAHSISHLSFIHYPPHPTALFCSINRWSSRKAVSRLEILAGLESLRSDSHYVLTVVFVLCSSKPSLFDEFTTSVLTFCFLYFFFVCDIYTYIQYRSKV